MNQLSSHLYGSLVSLPGRSTEPVLAQQLRHRRQSIAHALLFRQGKRDEPNIVQNSIISLDEFHRCARGGQAIARGHQRLRRTRQRQATLHFFPDIKVRNSWF
jgi:hypothetical protein